MSDAGVDPTKRAQCGVDKGLGNDGVTPAFEACLASSCHAECGLTCGGLAAVFPPATAPACETCIGQGIECAAMTQCATSPQCQTAVRCQFSTHTPDVQEQCPPIVPDAGGAPLGTANVSPIASSCSNDCSWGADWSCVGRVGWPKAELGPIEFDIGVYDLASQAPINQAAVRLCATPDKACSPPLASGFSGDAGTLVLVRPPVTTATFHYLDITSPAYVETLVFDVFPISEPRITTNVGSLMPLAITSTADGLMVNLDPNLGILYVDAFDCRFGNANGVQLTLIGGGPTTQVFYTQDGQLSPTATATDSSGEAIFVNVPVLPDTFTVNVMLPPALDGGLAGSMGAFARDGGLSVVYAVPTPPP